MDSFKELSALAERCRELPEASIEIEADIHWALFGKGRFLSKHEMFERGERIPLYTGRIDDALGLVPEGFTWGVDSFERVAEFPGGWFWASVHWPSSFDTRFERATHPWAPIAVCEVALRVRSILAKETA